MLQSTATELVEGVVDLPLLKGLTKTVMGVMQAVPLSHRASGVLLSVFNVDADAIAVTSAGCA